MRIRMYAIACSVSLLIAGCDITAQSDRHSVPATSDDVKTFSLGVTQDLVNIPWVLAGREGLITDIARDYGIRLEIVAFNSERNALRAFREGSLDALASNLNAMISNPDLVRRETIVPLLFGYSHGDYGIYSRRSRSPAQLTGETIHLPFGSTGHYFLFRVLELNQLSLDDVQLVNTPESQLMEEVVDGHVDTLIVSGPTLAQMQGLDDFRLVADSRSLYGEIMAGIAIDKNTADQNPRLVSGLVESWFVIMQALFDDNDQLNPNYLERTAVLSDLQPAELNRYLGVHNFMQTAGYAFQLMEGDNIRQLILGAERFLDASADDQCTAESANACSVERDGMIIRYGDGAKLMLDTSELQKLVEQE